jgi:glycerol dehydrogenase
LDQLGVDADSDKEIQTIAERAVMPGETIHNEPFNVSADAVACALKAADQQGRAYA